MKNFVLATALLFSAASAHAQSVQECKVDLFQLQEITTVQPAKSLDDASKELIVKAISYAITSGAGKYAESAVGSYEKSVRAFTTAEKQAFVFGQKYFEFAVSEGLSYDDWLKDILSDLDDAYRFEDELKVRVNGKLVLPAPHATTIPNWQGEWSHKGLLMGPGATLQTDIEASFLNWASLQLIEHDDGSVNDDLGGFLVRDETSFPYPISPVNTDTLTVLAASDEDGSIYEVKYKIIPGEGNLNDIPERLHCNTAECVDAMEPLSDDIFPFRPSFSDLKSCPDGYTQAGFHQGTNAPIAGNALFRVCELRPDCGDTFYPLEGIEYREAIYTSLNSGDIISLKTRIGTPGYDEGEWYYRGNSEGEGYLGRCSNCFPGVSSGDLAAIHVLDASRDVAQWMVIKLANGNFALQADNGKYLAICSDCNARSLWPNPVFVHANNYDALNAQFIIDYSPAQEGEYKYTLQSADPNLPGYLTHCLGCLNRDSETGIRLGLEYTTALSVIDPRHPSVKWSIEKRQPRQRELTRHLTDDIIIRRGEEVTIPADGYVIIPADVTVRVEAGGILTNRGRLSVQGHLIVGPHGEFRNDGFVSGGTPYPATGIIRTTGGAEGSFSIGNGHYGTIDLSNLRRLVNDGRVYNNGKIYDPWNKFWGNAPERYHEPELFQPIKALLLTQETFEYSCVRGLGGMKPQTGLEEGSDVCVVNNYWLRDYNSLVIDEGMTLLIEDGEFNSDGAIENNGHIDNSAGLLRQCHPDGITGTGTTADPVLGCVATPAEAECLNHGGTFERSMQRCTIGYAVASNQNYEKTIRVHSGSRWIINGQLNEYGRVHVEENADLDIIGGVLWTDSLVNYGRILVTADSDGFVGHLQPDGRAVNFGEIVDQGNIIGNGYVVNQCGAVYEPAQHGWGPNGVPYGYWVQGRDFYYNNVSFEECPPVDMDADGVEDSVDLFPLDPTESMDTDQDGVGDNADAFPEDPTETADSDGDGVGDNEDAFPEDVLETRDSDGDGVGDNSDAFPDDPREARDSDLDGVGDNKDALPNDPTESSDQDGDGTGDNSDAFPNDGKNTRLISVAADNNWVAGRAIFKDGGSGTAPLPGGITLPHGMVDFTLIGGNAGSETLLTITYPEPVDPDSVWLKFGRTAQNESLHWYPVHSLEISGNTVTLSLTDGGLGDDDLMANGIIVDPGGPALLAGPVTIVANDGTAMVPGVLPTTGQFTVDNGQFTVDLGTPNDTGAPMTVNYMVGGTATAVTDYGALTGSLVFEEGQQTATMDLTVYSTAQVSDTESVVVTLTDTNIPVWGVDHTPAQVTIKALPAAPEKADEPRSGGGGAMGLWLAPLLLGLGRRKFQAGNRNETVR